VVHSWPRDIQVRGRFGQTDICRQQDGVSSVTLVRLVSRLSEQRVKEQCGLVGLCFGGRMTLDLHLSVEELQWWDKTVTTNWITKFEK
jgi:dienelactone hydrolase